MSHLKWDESPHWNRPTPAQNQFSPIQKKSRHQIEDEIRDSRQHNGTNENQLNHLINIAIAEAKRNGTLADEREE